MSILPGWNSLDAVGSVANSLHITAIVVLALLVVAEGMALVYDSRKDALVGIAERAAATRQQEADERHRNEMAEVQRQLEQTRQQQAQRRLSPEVQEQLISALKPFAGRTIGIVCIMGDAEGMRYAEDFVHVFQSAGWAFNGPPGVSQAVYSQNPDGIQPTINQGEADAGRVPAAFVALVDTLARLHLADRAGFKDKSVSVGGIELRVGVKPRP